MKNVKLILVYVFLICSLTGCQNIVPAASKSAVAETTENIPAASENVPSTLLTDTPVTVTFAESATEAASTEIVLKDLDNVFGFADDTGKKIITLTYDTPIENPETYNLAIGNTGETIKIRFVGRQEVNEKAPAVYTSYYFDQLPGYIYQAVDGELVNNMTYFLTNDTVFDQSALIALISTLDVASVRGYYKKVDPENIARVENLKKRKIVDSELLSEANDGGEVCMFVFERIGDDMLASIAYINGDTVIFSDYPATYDETSTWRVDAGDEPGMFEVMFLANSDAGLILGITWGAPEGESAYILSEVNGTFQETNLRCSRYWMM